MAAERLPTEGVTHLGARSNAEDGICNLMVFNFPRG